MASRVQFHRGPARGRPEEDAMARYAPLLLLVVALSAGCALLPTIGQSTQADAFQQLKERRADLEDYSRACFSQGWGADATYARMTVREARQNAEELVARHARRQAEWETCQRTIGPKLEAYRGAVEQAKRQVRSASHVGHDEADRIGRLLEESVQSVATLVGDVYPTVIELERAYGEYFQQLRASAASDKKRLTFPDHIEKGERRVVRAMHAHVASAAGYLESFHRLAPSPETRGRMNAARIMAAIYRGLDHVTAEDERNEAQKLRDFQMEVQVARRIVEGEINDPAYGKFRPQTVARYRTMLGELQQAERALGKLVTRAERGPAPTKGGRDKVLARYQAQTDKLLAGVQVHLDRVEQLAHTIDAEP
jgi:hypothetical protein